MIQVLHTRRSIVGFGSSRVPPTGTRHVPGFVQQGGAQITRAQQTTKRRHVKSAVQRCQLASFLALLRNGTNAQRRQDMKGLNQRSIGHPVAVDAGVVVLRRKRSVWSVKEFEKKRQCQKMSSVKQYIGVRQDFEKTGNTVHPRIQLLPAFEACGIFRSCPPRRRTP